MLGMAKNMQLDKKHKKHKSLWEEEEKEAPEDPMEVADNTEYGGELPDIEIPEVAGDMSSGDGMTEQ